MFRLARIVAFSVVLVVVPATALAASGPSTVPGTWRKLPKPPVAIPQGPTSVWTGGQLILFGRKPLVNPSIDVAEAYDPATNTWTRLSPPPGPGSVPGYEAVWTGKQMLVFGAFHSVAYNPRTNVWRELPKAVPGGIVVWTGREAIGWGGGCCGDAWSNGAAYTLTTGAYRNLPRSPLAASQHPLGAWTGRELILFVSGFDPDGKLYPASKARAAAYNPATNRWRRIVPLPETSLGFSGTAVWNGRELLVAAVGGKARSAYAYNPATNHWRRLASLPATRFGPFAPLAVWTGKRLLLFGGQNASATRYLRDGQAYDPRTDRWSTIPAAPLHDVYGASAVWTGRSLIVSAHGGSAAFTPATP